MGSRYWLFAFGWAIFSLIGCSDMTLYRAGADYFPLVQDTRWTYTTGQFTLIDSVAGDTGIAERTAIVVLRSFVPEFWVRDRTGAWRYQRRAVYRGGNEVEVEARFARVYEFPLVLGNTWSETFRDTVRVLGSETLAIFDSLAGRVAAIEDVSTPAGTFNDCYRIELFRTELLDTLAQVTELHWLAPGVGLVKRLVGTDSAVLVDYRIGPRP